MTNHQHNYLPEVDGNGLKTGVVSCDCGAWESGHEDEGTYVDGTRITDEVTAYTCKLCGQRIDDGKPCGCGARY